MRKNIKLYIGDQEVDYSDKLSLPITYTLEDLKNPTIVKNSFSKTISIPGTKNNNKIFGDMFDLKKFIESNPTSGIGVKFDPSKRVDFKLFNGSTLVESGYIQLNNISVQNKVITYSITLYGGLGDFFYNLKYKEDGELKTLADLRYFIEDVSGNLYDEADEFNFKVNKELVEECMFYNTIDETSNTLKDFLTFIPAYNGVYENFDNETCLINTNEGIFPTSITKDDKTYTPYEGYGLAKLNKPYTEWEMRDLRSYKQRPGLKVSKLIKTICREENSGYTVKFDPDFFNSGNPYWIKSYVALPLLGSGDKETDNSTEGKLVKYNNNYWVGIKNGEEKASAAGYTQITDSDYIFSTEDIIDMSALPSGSLTTIDLPIQIKFTNNTTTTANKLYLSYVLNGKSNNTTYIMHPFRTSFVAQIMIFDAESTSLQPVAYSPIYNFTSDALGNNALAGPGTWFNYWPWTDAAIETIPGYFENLNGNFIFKSDAGSNIFHLVAKNVPKINKARVIISLNRYSESSEDILPLWTKQTMFPGTINDNAVDGSISINWAQNNYTVTTEWVGTVASDLLITKSSLLKTESTPADFLLSYSKLFGLYFIKDVNSKTITICTRNNFFKDSVVDWSDRIDYDKDLTITPLLFEKKWYKLSLETPDTYYAKKYNKEYDIDYGQKRLNTGYNFNEETEDLYKDNIYENVVTARDTSKYYRNFYTSDNQYAPAFLNDNITYTLYKKVSGELSSGEQELYGANFIDVNKTVEWFTVPGNDVSSKLCLYSLNGDEKSLSEISASLVLFDGYEKLLDINGNPIKYYITDDLSAMGVLNDGEFCYLYTNDEYNADGDRIAIEITSIPKYVRYVSSSGNITHSLDFGLPKEIYNDLEYNETATIYNKFWDKFYKDLFNVNTRKITCFVKLSDELVNNEALRKFYYFEDSYWILNKIEGYDINSDATTRCEFIKVQDPNNYLNGVDNLGSYIQIDPYKMTVDHKAGELEVEVQSNVNWEVFYSTSHKVKSISPSSGTAGITKIKVNYTANTNYQDDYFYLRVTPVGVSSGGATLDVVQTPNPDNVVSVYGKITYKQKPDWTPHICASNNNFTNCVYVRSSNNYKMYVPKGQEFTISLQGKYDELVSQKQIEALYEDININWEI